jgi:T-complex protein 1 subunit alpha
MQQQQQSAHQTALTLQGTRTHGQDVRTSNTLAVLAVANILKSSLGPQGLDKMLVDQIGDVTVTNDGATILAKLELEHPAAKVLQELSRLQDQEVGDGTTSVVLVASELLKRANDLIKNEQIHPTNILNGYRMAMKEAIKYVQSNLVVEASKLSLNVYEKVAKTSLSSKFVGADGELFAKLVVEAILSVKTSEGKFPVANINVLKSHGKSSMESQLITKGYAINLGRAAQGMPTFVADAKIALLDFDLKKYRMNMGVQIAISNPAELEKVRQKEMDITKDRINAILALGVNVIFTTRGIDDMALKYLIDQKVYAVRRVDKKDMKRIAKATGAKILLTLTGADADGWDGETIDVSSIGRANSVGEQRVGDNDFTFINGAAQGASSTVLLRGANEVVLEEAERSVHDALCAVSRAMESASLVPGAGAIESAVSLHLEKYAAKIGGREQVAVFSFAEALMVIPKTLAANAALDVTEIVANLRKAQFEGKQRFGLDLIGGGVFDALENGIVEPAVSKLKSFKFATEAAITILRIDDLIKLAPPEENQQ